MLQPAECDNSAHARVLNDSVLNAAVFNVKVNIVAMAMSFKYSTL